MHDLTSSRLRAGLSSAASIQPDRKILAVMSDRRIRKTFVYACLAVLMISAVAWPLLPRRFEASASIVLYPASLDNGADRDAALRQSIDDNAIQSEPGADTFVLGAPDLPSGGIDRITDFASGADTIVLGAQFGSLTAGALNATEFRVGKAARDYNDHIIYNPTTGALFYDQDGTGDVAQVQIAQLAVRASVTSADFWISNSTAQLDPWLY